MFPLVRGDVTHPFMPPLFVKGEVSQSDRGDKKVRFRYSQSKRRKSIRKKGVTCYALFAITRRGVPSRKGRELCPMGTKREARFGGVCRAHAVVSPLNFSAEFSLLLFCPAKEKQRNGGVWGGVEHSETEGIRKSVSGKTRDVKSLPHPSLCKRGALGATLSRPFPFKKGKGGGFFSKNFFEKIPPNA